jgi:hypothetical protein
MRWRNVKDDMYTIIPRYVLHKAFARHGNNMVAVIDHK